MGCLTSIDLVLRVSQTPVQATTLKTPLADPARLELATSTSVALRSTPIELRTETFGRDARIRT